METDRVNPGRGVTETRRTGLPFRGSVLFLVGILISGSSALGYYYYFVHSPPLVAAELFMDAMEVGDREAMRENILIRVGPDTDDLRPPTDVELDFLLSYGYTRGRILDQNRRDGRERSYHYLVYREPGGQVYALVVTEIEDRYHVVIPGIGSSNAPPYLWDYTWTN